MNKFIYCDKCGYNNEVKAILFNKCPKCNTPLIIDDEEGDIEIVKALLRIKNITNDNKGIIGDRISNIIRQAKREHEKFEKMGKITDEEVTDFLIDLWR